ncbi:Uu.00g034710.m01.CDS01 [Anthostomella pinea]|uniref:Uu.00g034710.m01.CDS01 n=1 Tax=Anthostomella pinea TaxID=933095 RepID=A0AAI8V473_9PEZI|nr:Uu.00g034710.m01.CDS01 [Anthostomella pinea]
MSTSHVSNGVGYVAQAVANAHADYVARNPTSAKAHQDAHVHMPGGNTRTVLYSQPFPMAIKSGSGNTINSADGASYVDFLGEFSAGLFGHSNPRIAEAVTEALKSGWNFGGESLYEKELARKVTERFAACGLEVVRFTNSGTEANTMAVGAALAYTGRKKVMVFTNGYHGGTFTFPVDLCRWMHAGCSGPPPCQTMNLPHEFVATPYNNVAETRAIIDGLPEDSLAAILIEPVQGSGGCRPATTEFLTFLRQKADNLGALLVFDEVMTSRLAPAGLGAKLGIKPDLMTLGKWLAGGMTIGAFGGRRDIMQMFDPASGSKSLMHSGTFNNNVVSMGAGIAGLDIFDAAKVEELNARGDRLKKGVTDLLLDTGIYPEKEAQYLGDVLEVDSFETNTRLYTGSGETSSLPPLLISSGGSMLNVRFTGTDAALWHNLYYHHMLNRGIYLAARGFTPLSLEITDENVDMYVGAVKEFLDKHLESLR